MGTLAWDLGLFTSVPGTQDQLWSRFLQKSRRGQRKEKLPPLCSPASNISAQELLGSDVVPMNLVTSNRFLFHELVQTPLNPCKLPALTTSCWREFPQLNYTLCVKPLPSNSRLSLLVSFTASYLQNGKRANSLPRSSSFCCSHNRPSRLKHPSMELVFAPCTFPSHITHHSPKGTGAAAAPALGAGAQRDTSTLTRVCCYIHSCRIRQPHPELHFKCKQAAAWSFPHTHFTPCTNSSADYLDSKIDDSRESSTTLLAPAVSYTFHITDEVLFVTSSFIWPLQISSYWYSVSSR